MGGITAPVVGSGSQPAWIARVSKPDFSRCSWVIPRGYPGPAAPLSAGDSRSGTPLEAARAGAAAPAGEGRSTQGGGQAATRTLLDDQFEVGHGPLADRESTQTSPGTTSLALIPFSRCVLPVSGNVTLTGGVGHC